MRSYKNGHGWDMNKHAAEFFETFCFVLGGCGSAVPSSIESPDAAMPEPRSSGLSRNRAAWIHKENLLKSTFVKAAGLALAGLINTGAFAQTVTDGQWRGNGGAALAVNSGNTSNTSLLLNANGYRATDSDKITLGGMYNYARSKSDGVSQTTANKMDAFAQYDYNLDPQWFGFGRLGLDTDKLQDLSLRSNLAGGLGYKLINTPETTFNLLGGVGYVRDKYSAAKTVGGTTSTSFSRASLYVGEESSHRLSSAVSFNQRLDLYPGVTGDKAVLARFVAGLNVGLSSRLNFSLNAVDSYNSKPPVGLKGNDLGIFAGVSVKIGAL
jgi:putative salt-induced outer membrane protein